MLIGGMSSTGFTDKSTWPKGGNIYIRCFFESWITKFLVNLSLAFVSGPSLFAYTESVHLDPKSTRK
jgi:hypothetical protein